MPPPGGGAQPSGKTRLRKAGAGPRVPPQRVPIQSASGVQHKLLFERQPVPPAVLLWCQSGLGGSLPRQWHRRSCEPGARLTDGVEMLMHSDEVQNVTSRLTAEAHETLVLDVDEETGIVVFMERTQSLPPPRPGAPQPHSGSLDHIEKCVLELHLADVAISSVLSSG